MAVEKDRRAGRRFPLKLGVDYRLFFRERGRTLQSKGTTKDISHTGLLLDTGEQHPVGTTAELLIDWPCGQDERQGMRLRVMGWVVRSDEHGTAVKILRYSFKSHGDDASPDTPATVSSNETGGPQGEPGS